MEVLNLVTFNSLILYLFEPVKELIDLVPKYNYLKASFNKLSDFINVLEEDRNKAGVKKIIEPNIDFREVGYSYNKFSDVIEKVNMTINPGDKVLLIGPSGSGKSTICKLMNRSLGEYMGDINYYFMSEKDYSLEAIRNDILYVGQNEKLFTGTIKENILSLRNISDEDFSRIAKICKLEEIVSKRPNRYNSVINAAINNLSGGEKQRIILARGLLKSAKIIILDEALSEVNEEMEKEILQNIFDNFKEQTLIYVTHKNVSDKFEKIINIGDFNDRNV